MLVGALWLVGVVGAALPAHADGASATVTVLSSGQPVDLAFVAVVDQDGTTVEGATTDADGMAEVTASLDPESAYSVVASKPGYFVGSGTLDAGATTLTVTLTRTATPLSYLNVYGAQVTGVVADGAPGVFYATTGSIPSLFRSTDAGGTWSPVTVTADQSQTGTTGLSGISDAEAARSIVTSGYPGEVGAIVGSSFWYSRDFGTTWNAVPLPVGTYGGRLKASWVHTVLAETHSSYLFLTLPRPAYSEEYAATTELHVAVMPTGPEGTVASGAADPTVTFQTVATSPLTDPDDLFAAAAGDGVVSFAVSRADGVDLYDLAPGLADSAALSQAVSVAAGQTVPEERHLSGLTRDLGNPRDLLLYGGPRTGGPDLGSGAGAPRSVVVYDRSGTGNDTSAVARMATYLDGGWAQSTGMYGDGTDTGFAPQEISAIGFGQGNSTPVCGENETPPVGSIAPVLADADAEHWSANAATMSMVRSCILVHVIDDAVVNDVSIPAGTVVVLSAPGANNNTGSAFSAGFDLLNDNVLISGDGAKGLVKASSFRTRAVDGGVKELGSTYGYRPAFPGTTMSVTSYTGNLADPGSDATSGGFSVKGLAAPTVRDIAYSPNDPDALVMTMSFTGGGRTVMSLDGGSTWFTFGGQGTNSVAWWNGAGDRQWVAAGGGNGGLSTRPFDAATYEEVRAAVSAGTDLDQQQLSPAFTFIDGGPNPNPGLDLADVGMDPATPSGNIEAPGLAGVEGTDSALVGFTRGQDSSLARVDLTHDGVNSSVGAVHLLAEGQASYSDPVVGQTPTFPGRHVNSIRYCSPTAAAAVADTAFITFGNFGQHDGALAVVTGASTSTPTLTMHEPGEASAAGLPRAAFHDLAVDCRTGVAVVGAANMTASADAWFYASANGGTAWTPIQVSNRTSLGQFQGTKTLAIRVVVSSSTDAVGALTLVGSDPWGNVIGTHVPLVSLLAGGHLPGELLSDGALGTAALNAPFTMINDTHSPTGRRFGQEMVGKIAFPAEENDVTSASTESAGGFSALAGFSALSAGDATPAVGSGAGALTASLAAVKTGQFMKWAWAPGGVVVGKTYQISAPTVTPATVAPAYTTLTPTQCTLTASSGKTYVVTKAAGTCRVKASVAATSQATGTSATKSLTVGRGTQVVANPATPRVGTSKVLPARSNAPASLVLSWRSSTPKVCTVAKGRVAGVRTGTCKLVATQAGNANWLAYSRAWSLAVK